MGQAVVAQTVIDDRPCLISLEDQVGAAAATQGHEQGQAKLASHGLCHCGAKDGSGVKDSHPVGDRHSGVVVAGGDHVREAINVGGTARVGDSADGGG